MVPLPTHRGEHGATCGCSTDCAARDFWFPIRRLSRSTIPKDHRMCDRHQRSWGLPRRLLIARLSRIAHSLLCAPTRHPKMPAPRSGTSVPKRTPPGVRSITSLPHRPHPAPKRRCRPASRPFSTDESVASIPVAGKPTPVPSMGLCPPRGRTPHRCVTVVSHGHDPATG